MITRLVGISANTLRSYLSEYEDGGIERLKQIRFHRPSSKLMDHAVILGIDFREHLPASINAAISAIETLTGIRRSPTQVRIFEKIGDEMSKGWCVSSQGESRCAGSLPIKQLEPRIEEAKAGKRDGSFSALCMVF